jgi:SAM-dependent methyltransferase
VEYLAGDKFMPGYTYPEDVIEIDLLALDCQDGVFDLIICNHVLEHIVDDRRAIREIHRVLKPTGTAILQVPLSKTTRKTEEDFEITDPEEREKLYGQPDHVRLYGLDYVDRLAECGFEVDILDIAADPKYNKAKLCKSEELYICSKS